MNGRVPLCEPKKLRNRLYERGLEMRKALLMEEGFSADFLKAANFRKADAGLDDFLDACACAWSAARIFRGEAIRFSAAEPPRDANGVRMQIFA